MIPGVTASGVHIVGGGGITFADDFNRADTTPGASDFTGLGSNWLCINRYAGGYTTPRITSNECVFGQEWQHALYVTPANTTDQEATVKWWTGQGETMGPVICSVNTHSSNVSATTVSSGYFVFAAHYDAGVYLQKDGDDSMGMNWNSGANWGATPRWVTFKITRLGNDIKVYVDGTLRISWTDSTSPLTGKYFGHGSWQPNGGAVRHDDFSGGDS